MASLRNPKTWSPYIDSKDCSQGFCSLYCPQWCYIIFPPPPPFEYLDRDSGSMFSPLVIAIIGVLASAFLLVSYYAIFTKCCKDRDSRRDHQAEEVEVIHQVPSLQESWHFTANNGLDEALIKLITVCQYKRGDGLVEGTECSVCLSEFEEGERLRLLPKCSHAFHLSCIDMWLKSHSNCPLCRANIISVTVATAQSQPPPSESENSVHGQSVPQMQPQDENVAVSQGTSDEVSGVAAADDAALKGLSSYESQMVSDNHDIELRDGPVQPTRRSISMSYIPLSIGDTLRMNQDGDVRQESHGLSVSKVLPSVLRPIPMKRSFSSGIFFANKHTSGQNSNVIPF